LVGFGLLGGRAVELAEEFGGGADGDTLFGVVGGGATGSASAAEFGGGRFGDVREILRSRPFAAQGKRGPPLRIGERCGEEGTMNRAPTMKRLTLLRAQYADRVALGMNEV
jgi:hypothetical protein